MKRGHFRGTRSSLRITALDRLAQEIRFEHAAVETKTMESLSHARAAGSLLLQAKGQMRHGRFMKWVEQTCEFSQSTANLYMRVAENWQSIEANSEHIANLSLGAVGRWLVRRKKKAALTYDRTLRNRSPDFMRRYRGLLSAVERVLQPNRPEYIAPATISQFDRLELDQVREELLALRVRLCEALDVVGAAINADAYATAERAEIEHERHVDYLAAKVEHDDPAMQPIG